jgi:hypothetical protein
MAIRVSKLKVGTLINSTGEQMFGVNFTKKDGSSRKMLAKLGVRKYLKGGKNKVVKCENDYVTVYDMKAAGYRTVNLATVKSLRIRGVEYEVV